MKDHVQEKRRVYIGERGLSEVMQELREAGQDLVGPYITDESWDGYSEFYVVGWRPMNEKELEKRKVERKQARERAKKLKEKQEASELAELKRLAEKFGVPLDV